MSAMRPENEPAARRPGWLASPGGEAIALSIADPGNLLDPGALSGLLVQACKAIAQVDRPGEVRVKVIGDAEMAAAHIRYSKVEGTTDVLTFDLSDGTELDVDILVCIDEARRQAKARGHTPERELLLYILHGVLHCMGYDDHDEAAFARMHAREDEILKAIGVGETFIQPARNAESSQKAPH